jgi:hypothetical protein
VFDSHENLVVSFQTADGIFTWAGRMDLYPRDSFVERRDMVAGEALPRGHQQFLDGPQTENNV